MRRNILSLVTAALASAAASAPAQADDARRLKLDFSAAPAAERAEIAVAGLAGRYDRIDELSLTAVARLTAEVADEAVGYRLLASQLFVKQEGGATAAQQALDPLAGAAPQRTFSADRDVQFKFSAAGPVALSAIASCNDQASSSGKTVRLPLTVVWRVTSGRFNYKWTAYDQVAPSDDIIANREFYSEQATEDVEAPLDVTVRCAPLAPAPASIAATKPASVPVVSKAHFAPSQDDAPNAAAPAARTEVVAPAVAPVAQRIAQAASKPVCDGGMVRQVSGADAGYLCLCPGNTERIATGENAFQCDKRSRRR